MCYHVFNEKLLSQQDLEKADEIHEHTAQHLLDKFANITNKFRSLMLAESMREVRLAEVVMIDRLRNAEEETLTKAAKQAKEEEEAFLAKEVAALEAAEEAALQAAKVKEAVAAEVAEAVATVADGAVVSIDDVEADLCGIKSELILNEIDGDSPNLQDEVRIAKTEALKLEAIKCEKSGDGNEEYNEWEAIKQELGYRPPENSDEPNHVSSGHYGDWELSPFCPSKDEDDVPERIKNHKRCTGPNVNGEMDDFLCPKKKLRIYDEIDELGDTDLSAQVQSAIDSIINLQLPQLPSSPEQLLASLHDHEDDSTLLYSSSMPTPGACPPHGHSQSNSLGSGNNPHTITNSHSSSSASNTDSALDEAVRSILTS